MLCPLCLHGQLKNYHLGKGERSESLFKTHTENTDEREFCSKVHCTVSEINEVQQEQIYVGRVLSVKSSYFITRVKYKYFLHSKNIVLDMKYCI